ncbi:hypothetical protein FG386_001495 [Cryptosporidium ryanae]|uniref:uncharacterized protein n=1 Tax=Cryptosporidium ryanae TaxID=515981 RepID=UPI00351AA62E|nr:hypothetical protein FG386_001495 [Cryptosporidium ryanae]
MDLIQFKSNNYREFLYIKKFEDECLKLIKNSNFNSNKFYDTCSDIINSKNINISNNTEIYFKINNSTYVNGRKLQIKSGFGSHIRLPPVKTTLLNGQNNDDSVSNSYNTWDVCNSILSLHFIKICEKLCTDNSMFSVKEETFPRSCFPSCTGFAKNICIQGCSYFGCGISYELCTYQMCNFSIE